MSDPDIQPRELSTGRGNFLSVLLNLATGGVRVLSDAEAEGEAAEATRRATSEGGELRILTTSAR